MRLNEFYEKPLREVLTEMDIIDVKVYSKDNKGEIAAIEVKYRIREANTKEELNGRFNNNIRR